MDILLKLFNSASIPENMLKYFFKDLGTDEYQAFSTEKERNQSLLRYLTLIYLESPQWEFMDLDYGDFSNIIIGTITHKIEFSNNDKINIVEL